MPASEQELEELRDYFSGGDDVDQTLKKKEWKKKTDKKEKKIHKEKKINDDFTKLQEEDKRNGESNENGIQNKTVIHRPSEAELEVKGLQVGIEPKITEEVKTENQEVKKEEVETEIVVEREKTKNENVWYEGIMDELRIVSLPDEDLSPEEKEKRPEIFEKLKKRGVILPKMSGDIKDKNTEADINRMSLRAALEFLINPLLTSNRFRNREVAIRYLKELNIGDRVGVEYELEKNEKVGEIEEKAEESDGQERDEKRKYIQDALISLTETSDESTKNNLLDYLENLGVSIRKLLDDSERVAPGQSEMVISKVGEIVKAWIGESEGNQIDRKMAEKVSILVRRLEIE